MLAEKADGSIQIFYHPLGLQELLIKLLACVGPSCYESSRRDFFNKRKTEPTTHAMFAV